MLKARARDGQWSILATEAHAAGQVNRPAGDAMGADGDIYAADQESNHSPSACAGPPGD